MVVMGTYTVQEEILTEILSRLPVTSLLRFKCVSESWNTLISEPYFKKKHLNQANNQLNSQKMLFTGTSLEDNTIYFYCCDLSLLDQHVKDIRRFDWPLNPKLCQSMIIYCSCDGLFIIGIFTKFGQQEPPILLLWNPSTGESIVLPHSELSPPEVSTNGSNYGLGYDSTTDDYKVLRINMSGFDDEHEIMSLKGGVWRKIDETSGRTNTCFLSIRDYLVFVHGAFHWFGSLSRWHCVISFNISDEMFRPIPFPEMMYLLPLNTSMNIEVDIGVSALEGMLCVYHNDRKDFKLWVMKDYGNKESWTKLFTIPSNGIHCIIPIYSFSDEVLLNYEEIRTAYRIVSDGSLGFSNRIWHGIDAVTVDWDGHLYTESLISPKLGH